jgi:hypothetical protein
VCLTRVRRLTHTVAHAFARSRTGKSCQHRRRAGVVTPSPRRPSTPGLAPFEPSHPGGYLWSPRLDPSPRRRGTRRRRGYPAPPSPRRHLVKHLGTLLKTRVGAMHGWPHVGVATARPPGSTAAKPLTSRPHTGPYRTEPHDPSRDHVRQPTAARRHAGRRAPGRTRSGFGGSERTL